MELNSSALIHHLEDIAIKENLYGQETHHSIPFLLWVFGIINTIFPYKTTHRRVYVDRDTCFEGGLQFKILEVQLFSHCPESDAHSFLLLSHELMKYSCLDCNKSSKLSVFIFTSQMSQKQSKNFSHLDCFVMTRGLSIFHNLRSN